MSRKSAWIFIGGLLSDLTEGDIITVFSQFGEVVNINLPRHKQTGNPRGFCFLCYRDQASTTLAVDNFNGITVDYVEEYKEPKYRERADEDVKRLWEEGCAPKPIRWMGVERKETIRNVRKKHHKKRKERKDHKENLVKVRKSSCAALARTGKNDSYGKIEALRNKKEALIYNPRPEYGKGNWREVEIWREVRRREKERGDDMKKIPGTEYDQPFIPNRYR
ncbi:hypothetical protein Aduo_014445 [Ancylostoma duodenale]